MEAREISNSNEIDLMDYIRPLVPWWRLLLLAFFVGGVTGYIVSLTLPKQYRSSAVVFVQQNSGAASLLRSLPIPVSGGSGTSSGYITTLLQSESMRLDIIKKTNLLKDNRVFPDGEPKVDDALRQLQNMIQVNEGKSGAITVSVTAPDPKLAAEIANTSVDLLDTFVMTASGKKADFTAKRIDETLADLEQAEDDLKDFMERYDVASIDEQTKGMITQLGEMEGALVTMQAQLEGVTSEQQNAADLNRLAEGEVQRKSLAASIEYLRQQRDELRDKLSQLPSIGAKYARIQRRIIVLNKTYEVLTEQYQLARVTQTGEDGDYQIIDRARPKPNKVAPSNAVNAALGAMLAFLAAAIGVSVIDRRPSAARRTSMPKRNPLDDETLKPAKRG